MIDESNLCMAEATLPWSRTRYCSLEPNHEGPHVAYNSHIVTDNGKDVYWLGPWDDDRPYEGEQCDRLQTEWYDREML